MEKKLKDLADALAAADKLAVDLGKEELLKLSPHTGSIRARIVAAQDSLAAVKTYVAQKSKETATAK